MPAVLNVWNEDKNAWEGIEAIQGAPGEVKISQAEGNLLELREDGLYVGVQALAEALGGGG